MRRGRRPTFTAHLPAGHEVGQQRDVPPVDVHSVALHRDADLVHDRLPRRLDAQRRANLVSVVRGRLLIADSPRRQNLAEVVT